MQAITEFDGSDTVIVRALSTGDHGHLATALLNAAGPDRKREVQSTSRGGRGFLVPLDIATAAGFVRPDEEPEPEAATDEDGQGDGAGQDDEQPGADADSGEQPDAAEQPVEDVPDEPAEEPAKPARRPRGKTAAGGA